MEQLKKNENREDGCFTYEDLKSAFKAGCRFENGEQRSWATYNTYTGYKQQNKQKDFKEWYEEVFISLKKTHT
jgi:hypothetical protein